MRVLVNLGVAVALVVGYTGMVVAVPTGRVVVVSDKHDDGEIASVNVCRDIDSRCGTG